jgi:hypothetical protein
MIKARPSFSRISRFTALSLTIVSILPACAWHRKKHPQSLPPAGPRRVGTVAVVKEDLHFVLVDVGSLYIPTPGTALKTFSGGVETGIIAVNPERQRPFIAADIVKGQPKVGDEVQE